MYDQSYELPVSLKFLYQILYAYLAFPVHDTCIAYLTLALRTTMYSTTSGVQEFRI